MNIRVAHRISENSFEMGSPIDFDNYVLVADVECGDFNDAYEFTNTIRLSWWKNHSVKPLFEGDECRSTAPGDLMIDIAEGKVYVVGPVGFHLCECDNIERFVK